jgi:hypothetical protein
MLLNRWYFSILFFLVPFLSTDIARAAGMIARVQQMQAQKRQQQQQQYQQYQQSQQGPGSPDQGQPQAGAPPTYQQTVDERNQAIAQAIISAHSEAVSSTNVPFGNDVQINQDQQQGPLPAAVPQPQAAVGAPSSNEVQDTVDLSEVWKKLDTKSTVWPLLMDDQAKVLTVSEYIGRYQQEGVKIGIDDRPARGAKSADAPEAVRGIDTDPGHHQL